MSSNVRPETMQRITTKEPDEAQLEVAIAALKHAMPEEFPPEEKALNRRRRTGIPLSGSMSPSTIWRSPTGRFLN